MNFDFEKFKELTRNYTGCLLFRTSAEHKDFIDYLKMMGIYASPWAMDIVNREQLGVYWASGIKEVYVCLCRDVNILWMIL